MSQFHRSVLLEEVIEFLQPAEGKLFIDATAGGGGHSEELVKRGAKVLAIDRDEEAIEYIRGKNLKNLTLRLGNFSHIHKIAAENNFTNVHGIIFDLGVSSHQIDEAQRGFSFQKSGPLDMRMDNSIKVTAKDLINNLDKRRLNEIFSDFGQEKFSLAIADAIVGARQVKSIETTDQLAKIIREVYAKKRTKGKTDPATKVFQALRIVVNSELLNLEESLPQTVEVLSDGGRLVVISFHSLEDGTVKRFFKRERRLNILTKTPIGPQKIEVEGNPRARSARLRAAEKIGN